VKYDASSWDPSVLTAGGLPLSSVAPGISSPQPYGTVQPRVSSSGLPADWLWQDPSGSARLSGVDTNTVKVTVPSGNDLWGGTSTAPRLLHKVTGDFSLQGRVNLACKCTNLATAEFLLYAPGSSPGYVARQMDSAGMSSQYQILGGGWLRMQGLDTLTALDYAQMSDNPKAPDKPVWLRLTRQGDLWRTYSSMDGKTWLLTGRQTVAVPDTVWVGWVFKRVADDGLTRVQATTTLQNLSLTTMPRGTLPDATWDVPQLPATPQSVGTVTLNGDQAHLALSSKPLGTIAAFRNGVLTGDFDAIVWFNVQRWTQKPGQTHRLWLAVQDVDGKNYAYVGLFENPTMAHGYYTDLMLNGQWDDFQGLPSTDWQGELRIVRTGSVISTYVLSGDSGQWKRIDQFNTGFVQPVWLEVAADNAYQATAPASVTEDFTVVWVETGAMADISQSTLTAGPVATGSATGTATTTPVPAATTTPTPPTPLTSTRVYGQPNFTANTANTGGVSASSLYDPFGVAFDRSGNLYVADESNNRVLYYPAGSTTATRVYGQPSFTANAANTGGVSASSLFLPMGVALDASGNLYVADHNNSRVLYYPASCSSTEFACPATRVYGQPSFTSNSPNGGGVSAGSLSYPTGMVLDTSGNLYVADYYNSRVLYYPAGSTTATRVYGQPSFSSNTANTGGVGTGSLHYPIGVALDRSGSLYVTDTNNSRVLYYPASCSSTDFACPATRVYGQPDFASNSPNGGGVGAGSLSYPAGLALDRSGNLYVADYENSRVLYYPASCSSTDFACPATRVYGQADFTSTSPNDGGVSAGSLYYPAGLALDGSGNLYVADQFNNRVLLFPIRQGKHA